MSLLKRNRSLVVATGVMLLTVPVWRDSVTPVYFDNKTYENRTAIVTGASGNLGKALTYQLAKRKMRIIMACRDMEKCKVVRREIALLTGHKGLACRQLDLEDIDSINRFADEMRRTEPHIDILINNAAVKCVENREINKYGIEKNYFVNFVAPFLLTFRLMDQLKESSAITKDSRVINVTGTPNKKWEIDLYDINFVKRKYSAVAAYQQSKLALAHFTILLNNQMKEKGINIYAFGTSPGATSITKALDRPTNFWEQLKAIISSYYTLGSDRAVNTAVKCALDPKLADHWRSGRLYKSLFLVTNWGKVARDKEEAKLVWNSGLNLLLNMDPPKTKLNDQNDD